MLHANALVKWANLGFLVVGAVAIAGGGGLGGCSSKSSSPSTTPGNDAASSSSGGSSDSGYSLTTSGADGSTTIFSGGGPLVDLPDDAAACAGAACNGLNYGDAPVIEEALVPGSPPAFTGGTLVDGTYYLTSVAIYGADSGASVVSDVTEEAGLDDDASGDGAISDGASGDGAISDGASGAISDAATGDGATFIGTPNGSFVEVVFAVYDGATIAQLDSASALGCNAGTVHLATSGNMLTMSPFCGNPFDPTLSSGVTWSYTATSTTIMASLPVNGGATAVLTLTLQ